jgi:hypothetical protein
VALPYSETWTGTNGDAWSGDWTTSNSSGTTLDIQSNTGRILTGSLGSFGDYGRALLADQSSADFDMTVDILPGVQEEKYPIVGFRGNGSWATSPTWPQNGYGVELRVMATPASGFYSVERVDAGTRTGLSGQVAYTITAGDTIHMNVVCYGTAVEFRIWKNAESKPTEPTYAFTDTVHNTRTRHSVGLTGGAGTVDDIYFDNLDIVTASPRVSVVAVSAQTASASSSASAVLPSGYTTGDLLIAQVVGRPSGTAGSNDTISLNQSWAAVPSQSVARVEIGTQDLNQQLF